MGLVSSPAALDLVLALAQRREGARLAELAAAAGISLSSAQTAVKLLLADGIVERDAGPRPRYRLRADHPARGALLTFAAQYAPAPRALAVVLRANPAVEFAARDRGGYLVVEGALADPRDVALLDETLRLVRGDRDQAPRIARFGHHELIDALRDDPAPRRRAERATIVKGSLARSFPSRAPRRATRRGRRGSLARPSRRALAALARAHGLRHIRLFGSAARRALRPDSDVDVVVEPRAGRALSLLDLVRIEADLERLLDRHVDVVTPGGLRVEVRDRVEREAVTLYDRSRAGERASRSRRQP